MNLIKQSYEIIHPTGDFKKDIELAARVSYKSEDRITEGSAEKMFNNLVNNNHTSCLEFGTIYLTVPIDSEVITGYTGCHWNKFYLHDGNWYITTNARHVQRFNLWDDVKKYGCEPTEYHAKRITVKFTTNRAVSHELVRHRMFSFCQESQRFVNYSKAKFGSNITFIEPVWEYDEAYLDMLKNAEQNYFTLLNKGWTPQQARTVLPNETKTEIYMCGYLDDWEHFNSLRTAPSADPMMRDLVDGLYDKIYAL